MREARHSFIHLYVFDKIFTLNLFHFLLKDIVELTFKILLHNGLLSIMLLHLVINIVLILLDSYALHQRYVSKFTHSVIELLSQQVVLPLTIQASIQLEVFVITIALRVRREHACDAGSVLQFFDLLNKNS